MFFGRALKNSQERNKEFVQEDLKKELLEFGPDYSDINCSTDTEETSVVNIQPPENDLQIANWDAPQLIKNDNCSIEDFENDYSKLQVVNPTKDKFRETVFQQNYYQLLRMLSFELEKRDSILIVFGFSFADEHILEIIRRSIINPYLKVFVICYDESSRENIKNKLGNVGPNQIDFLPYDYNYVIDGQKQSREGNFDYLNYLFSGRSNSEE